MGIKVKKSSGQCYFCGKRSYELEVNKVENDRPPASGLKRRRAMFCNRCLKDLIVQYTLLKLEGAE